MTTVESVLPQILLIIILIMVNAFLAGSEMAIVSTNKNKLKILIDEGNKKQKIRKLMEEPSKLLSTIQIGITFAGFLAFCISYIVIRFIRRLID